MNATKPPTYDGTMDHTADGGVVDPGSFMCWELEAVDTGCVLRLSHFVIDASAAVDNGYVVGLYASLARLVPCLSGRPVAWDWDGLAEAQVHYAAIGLAGAVS